MTMQQNRPFATMNSQTMSVTYEQVPGGTAPPGPPLRDSQGAKPKHCGTNTHTQAREQPTPNYVYSGGSELLRERLSIAYQLRACILGVPLRVPTCYLQLQREQ
jgi:hypothetical protein